MLTALLFGDVCEWINIVLPYHNDYHNEITNIYATNVEKVYVVDFEVTSPGTSM